MINYLKRIFYIFCFFCFCFLFDSNVLAAHSGESGISLPPGYGDSTSYSFQAIAFKEVKGKYEPLSVSSYASPIDTSFPYKLVCVYGLPRTLTNGDDSVTLQPGNIFGLSNDIDRYRTVVFSACFTVYNYNSQGEVANYTYSSSNQSITIYNPEYLKSFLTNNNWTASDITNSDGCITGFQNLYLSNVSMFHEYTFGSPEGFYEYIMHNKIDELIPPTQEPSSTSPDYNDPYDENVDIPVLTNLTFDGFDIKNPNGYDFEVVVDYRLYGSKINGYDAPMTHSRMYLIQGDPDWIFKKKTLNFQTSNISPTTDGKFSIKDFYHYDLFSDYTMDWLTWNNRYPDAKSLPSYNKLTHTLNPPQGGLHQWYRGDMTSTEPHDDGGNYPTSICNLEKWMRVSRKWGISYTVRFYDISKNVYGQWYRYTLNPGSLDPFPEDPSTGDNGDIDINPIIGGDENGNPIIGPGDNLIWDPGSGGYVPPGNLPITDITNVDINSVIDIFNNLNTFIGNVPALFANLFSFIPFWLQALIFGSISIACLLSIYHFIRG